MSATTQDSRMTYYDTEFHFICTCQTIEYEQQQKLTIHSPLCFEMTEDLQIYALMLLFLRCLHFVPVYLLDTCILCVCGFNVFGRQQKKIHKDRFSVHSIIYIFD